MSEVEAQMARVAAMRESRAKQLERLKRTKREFVGPFGISVKLVVAVILDVLIDLYETHDAPVTVPRGTTESESKSEKQRRSRQGTRGKRSSRSR